MLLVATSLTKSFSGVHALRGLSFELLPGEVHALVGENGAGKTTFVRIVTGADAPDTGTLEMDGAPVTFDSPSAARARGIAAIHQQPALFPDLTVAENIALATEREGAWRRIRWRERHARSHALLERLGADIDPSRTVDRLSFPEQQLVEIAKAVGARARLLLMDEPTASLTGREVDRLFAVVDRLRSEGAGIIYISHRLEEVRRIADRVTVIRDGRTIAAGLDPRTPEADIIRWMAGREIEPRAAAVRRTAAQEVALDVRQLTSPDARFTDVSLSVRRGEILGVAGLVGAGRTELGETLFGLRPAASGEIVIGGRRQRFRSAADAIRAGVAYVPEDRRRHGVIADFDVAANTSLASLERVATRGFVNRTAEETIAAGYMRRFNIKASSVRDRVGTLSGGNQQKVALARWLATSPSVLILDEPTQGVDVAAKAEIHALMEELAADGLAIVLISSDLPEVLALSDRVLVLHRGRVTGCLDAADGTADTIMTLALNRPALESPDVVGL